MSLLISLSFENVTNHSFAGRHTTTKKLHFGIRILILFYLYFIVGKVSLAFAKSNLYFHSLIALDIQVVMQIYHYAVIFHFETGFDCIACAFY